MTSSDVGVFSTIENLILRTFSFLLYWPFSEMSNFVQLVGFLPSDGDGGIIQTGMGASYDDNINKSKESSCGAASGGFFPPK